MDKELENAIPFFGAIFTVWTIIVLLAQPLLKPDDSISICKGIYDKYFVINNTWNCTNLVQGQVKDAFFQSIVWNNGINFLLFVGIILTILILILWRIYNKQKESSVLTDPNIDFFTYILCLIAWFIATFVFQKIMIGQLVIQIAPIDNFFSIDLVIRYGVNPSFILEHTIIGTITITLIFYFFGVLHLPKSIRDFFADSHE